MSPEIDKDIKILDLGIKNVNFGRRKFADDPIVAPSQKRGNSTSHEKKMGGLKGWNLNQPRQRLTDVTAKAYKGRNPCNIMYVHCHLLCRI